MLCFDGDVGRPLVGRGVDQHREKPRNAVVDVHPSFLSGFRTGGEAFGRSLDALSAGIDAPFAVPVVHRLHESLCEAFRRPGVKVARLGDGAVVVSDVEAADVEKVPGLVRYRNGWDTRDAWNGIGHRPKSSLIRA
jgi:hypothetical protein